jgi:hypothetical protein
MSPAQLLARSPEHLDGKAVLREPSAKRFAGEPIGTHLAWPPGERAETFAMQKLEVFNFPLAPMLDLYANGHGIPRQAKKQICHAKNLATAPFSPLHRYESTVPHLVGNRIYADGVDPGTVGVKKGKHGIAS